MSKKVILAAVLVVLLALPVAVYAEVEPEVEAGKFVDAVNAGDAAAASAVVAEDVVVEAPAAMSGAVAEGGDPSAQEQHVGKAEAEAWIEGHMSAGGQTTLGECTVEGEIATCGATFTSNALAAMGVASIAGTLAIQVNSEGLIQAYNFTPTAESAAALQAAAAGAAAGEAAAAPETLAVTGGSDFLPLALFIVLGGLVLVANGLGLQWLQRLGRRVD